MRLLPASDRLRIVVLGFVVRGPLGGMVWSNLHYVMGLLRLGHDVYLVEDSDDYTSYLASSRPVLAQETGFSERLSTGRALLGFRDMREAVAGAAEIDGNYEKHSRAARELAEAFFDSRKCLTGLLAACDS